MRIDWLTVAAQIVNFLVLVWLLKRFLYQRVLNAMDRREERIASRLREAEAREKEARSEAEAFRSRSAELEREREARLAQARDEAEDERHALVAEARAEADASREHWRQELEREQGEWQEALSREIADSALNVARRALSELAGAKLEAEVLATLLRRLDALPEAERRAFADAAPAMRLATAFELDDAALERASAGISAALGKDVELEWSRKPALVLGAELSAGGHKLDWSVSDYIEEMAERVNAGVAEMQGGTRAPARETADAV